MINLAENTRWLYVGPGTGRNEVHTVVLLDASEVTTVSFVPDRKSETGTNVGHAWNGPIPEFLKQFKSIPQ